MEALTPDEDKLLAELTRLAGSSHVITGRQLRDAKFADFVAELYNADVAYPQSLQSRKLQILRDKERITMRNGVYTIL